MKKPVALLFLLAAFTLVLTACGGGGGSTPVAVAPPPPPVSPPTPTPPVVVPGNLQTSVPAPTYAAGSQELAFFNLFNDFRGKIGLGLLAQNAAMDAADQNHLKYLLTNTDVNLSAIDPKTGVPYMHEEDPLRAGYTGVTPLDRAKFTQYPGPLVSEQVSYGLGNGAATAFAELVAGVYHRQGLMYQFPRDVGVSAQPDQSQIIVMTFGYQTAVQRNASDYFGTYPADKQTGVALASYPELPNPYPDVAYSDYSTKTSFPVNVVSEASTTLAVTTFTVTEAGQSNPISARLMNADNDPNKLLGKNSAYLIGNAPFKASTTYNASFTGTVNGVVVTRNWSFTTGP